MNRPRRVPRPAGELARYLRTETVGGMVLLAAAAAALVWANSSWGAGYRALRDTTLGPAGWHLELTVAQWATDGLLAVFFFVVGCELKRELVTGELAGVRSATLPVAAALGGMVVPAAIALAVLHPGLADGSVPPEAVRAWTIPVATDIAFALAVLALAGTSLPPAARAFLLGLAVVDDLGAIAVIAVLFTTSVNWWALLAAAALAGAYWLAQWRRITSPLLYLPLALATWLAVHGSGVHATVAGVALGLLTRVRSDPVRDPGERTPPALRLEHRLQPWSAGLCVPLFALFAAGVPVSGSALRATLATPVPLAVGAGLLVGKLIGILGFSFLAVRLTPACRPAGLTRSDMVAVSMLGGVGFTISLLLADLSLAAAPQPVRESAKAAVLIASALSAASASVMLVVRSRAHRRGR